MWWSYFKYKLLFDWYTYAKYIIMLIWLWPINLHSNLKVFKPYFIFQRNLLHLFLLPLSGQSHTQSFFSKFTLKLFDYFNLPIISFYTQLPPLTIFCFQLSIYIIMITNIANYFGGIRYHLDNLRNFLQVTPY